MTQATEELSEQILRSSELAGFTPELWQLFIRDVRAMKVLERRARQIVEVKEGEKSVLYDLSRMNITKVQKECLGDVVNMPWSPRSIFDSISLDANCIPHEWRRYNGSVWLQHMVFPDPAGGLYPALVCMDGVWKKTTISASQKHPNLWLLSAERARVG